VFESSDYDHKAPPKLTKIDSAKSKNSSNNNAENTTPTSAKYQLVSGLRLGGDMINSSITTKVKPKRFNSQSNVFALGATAAMLQNKVNLVKKESNVSVLADLNETNSTGMAKHKMTGLHNLKLKDSTHHLLVQKREQRKSREHFES